MIAPSWAIPTGFLAFLHLLRSAESSVLGTQPWVRNGIPWGSAGLPLTKIRVPETKKPLHSINAGAFYRKAADLAFLFLVPCEALLELVNAACGIHQHHLAGVERV